MKKIRSTIFGSCFNGSIVGCDKASHDTIQDTLNEMTLEKKSVKCY